MSREDTKAIKYRIVRFSQEQKSDLSCFAEANRYHPHRTLPILELGAKSMSLGEIAMQATEGEIGVQKRMARGVSLAAWLMVSGGVTLLVIAIAIETRSSAEVMLRPAADRSGDDNSAGETGAADDGRIRYTTTIRAPSGPPVIELGSADPQGRRGSIACSTCHSVREPNFDNRVPADLDQFHQNMTFVHGTVTCYACHNPTNMDALRLADGTSVEFSSVMNLCAQCHGTQARDYQHGAHGGMNGYWDLTRGPRTRNHCIDCHDPHSPTFPHMQPMFKPRDRFLKAASKADAHHE